MSDIKCCFFCTYYTGTIVFGFCSSDTGTLKLILSPCSQSCPFFSSALGVDLDDLPEYDPSDPFGSVDPELYDNFSNYLDFD